MNCLQKLENGFLAYDFFGHKVDFCIKSQRLVKSKFGALISLIITGTCLFILINNLLSWVNFKNFHILTDSRSFSLDELKRAN